VRVLIPPSEPARGHLWTLTAAAASLPLVVILCATLWVAPYPISDSIGHFEDVVRRPASSFLLPSSAYYRPLFYITLSAIWNNAPSIADALTAIRFLHIVPILALVALLLVQVRPRSVVDAAAAMLAVAVLLGSPGFRENLELPLSYTIVGMPAVLGIWILLERQRRRWRSVVILALMLIAVGFKEQGLVAVPLIAAAWWLGAPGASRGMALTAALFALVYVAFRLNFHDERLPMFEQDVGFGFSRLSSAEAEARFGGFPLSIFLYSSASTIANVLFSEPTEGVFRIVAAFTGGATQPWHVVHLISSAVLTTVILWWGVSAWRSTGDWRTSPDFRLFLLMLVVLAATGALSFNYSRDRLGGMAVPLYAMAAYYSVRAAAMRATSAPLRAVAIATLLLVLAAAWQLRALHTLENTRQRAVNTEREWSTLFAARRLEFSDRTAYTQILEAMLPQGTNPDGIRRTRYPRWFVDMLGEY
jgi:hypothetical protein